MDNFSITQYGKPLDESKYSIDLKNKTFRTKESDLVLDFRYLLGWEFTTGSTCMFNAGDNCHYCMFNTGDYCKFSTHSNCTFNTGSDCIFITGHKGTFYTGRSCTFNTGDKCNFTTKICCSFKTGRYCTFRTGIRCTFALYVINSCTFKTYDDMSIILDYNDNKAYKLTKDLRDMLKVIHG